MLRLEDIKKDAAVNGIEPGQTVRIVTTGPVGENALTVYYRTADGQVKEQMLFRSSEASLSLAEAGRPWAFDAPGRMKGGRDLSWIAGCASTEALLHPGWSVATDLPPLPEADELPEGRSREGRGQPVGHPSPPEDEPVVFPGDLAHGDAEVVGPSCGRRPTSRVLRGGRGYLCYDCLKTAKRPAKGGSRALHRASPGKRWGDSPPGI